MKLFKKISHLTSQAKGFTLIELIIVMAVLGILAAGLIAALNPVEQINRGRDTSNKTQAREVADAVNRYYSSSNTFPWGSNQNATLSDIVTTLKSSNELKTSFTVDSTHQSLVIDPALSTALICVNLQSKGGQQSGNYSDAGVTPCTPGGGGPGPGGGGGIGQGAGGNGLCQYYCISTQ